MYFIGISLNFGEEVQINIKISFISVQQGKKSAVFYTLANANKTTT